MEKEWGIKKLKLADLVPNGSNPRTITEAQLNKLKKQIKECGFHNPLIIDENNVILGGNQRYNALSQMFNADFEVYVRYPKFQLTDKQKQEIVITDNISDGEWNFEMLANEFDAPDLIEWGVDIPNAEEIEFPELAEGERSPFQQMSFTLADEQAELIKNCIDKVKDFEVETFGNENSNGNALYYIVSEWSKK